MLRCRKSLCTAAALAVLVVPSLSGCAAGGPGAARAQAGVVGELFEQLKREDDEAEAREYAALRKAGREQQELENEQEVEWR
jgi:hypothetical protein